MFNKKTPLSADPSYWNVRWPIKENPVQPNMFISFKGNRKGEIVENVHGIIIHEGYKLKFYISLGALLVLSVFCLRWFGIDSGGFFLREKRGTNA